jgi:hypothetical protein
MGMLETLGVVLLVVLALVLGWNARGNAGNATGKRPSGRRIQPANAAMVFFSTCIVVALARLIYSPESVDELAVTNRPIEVQADGHVTSRTCQACHPDQYDSWYHSYHRSMTQVATPETVAGDFGDLSFNFIHEYMLTQRGDEFWVASDDPTWGQAGSTETDGRSSYFERQVVLTTGSHHEQMYWFWTGESRKLKLFPFAYRVQEERWLPFTSVLLTAHQLDPEVMGRWNGVCNRCHTTHSRPNIESVDEMDTQVSEWGIACESCHGPAEEHVRVNRNPQRRYAMYLGDEPDPTIVHPERLDSRRSSYICGSCHSAHAFPSPDEFINWTRDGFVYRPGDDLEKTRVMVQPAEELSEATRRVMKNDPYFLEDRFWPDGMVLVGGREFNGTMESPCYKNGPMECISCHQMHKSADDPRSYEEWADDQLGFGMDGDAACTQCHPAQAVDITAHTHHPPESEGSRCYNCHMPNTSYGLLKASRSHQVNAPDTRETLEAGRPNACNLCHLDRTLAWTAQHLETWYGIERPELPDLEHSITADGVLQMTRGHAGQRALVAWGMGWEPAREASGTDWMAPLLAHGLEDSYGAVRDISIRTLRSLPGYEGLDYDALMPPAQRAQARERALAIWNETRNGSKRANRSEVLLDSKGALREAKLDRLLRERDTRRVNRGE